MTESTGVVAVDTNILLSLVRPDEPQRSQVRDAMLALRVSGTQLVVLPQIVDEFWSVATRPRSARNGLGLSTTRVESAVVDMESRFTVLPDRPETYDLWKELVTRYSVIGTSVHDARLDAAMLAHDVTRLLTFDTGGFARYSEIEVLDPATFV